MAVVTITATGAGTWTAPIGVSAIIVECWGGGGAGGQRSSNNSGAGGGGGGAYSRVNAMPVTGGVVYNYTVGIGGTDGGTPVNGGTTTFTGDSGGVCIAPGATSVGANSQTGTAGAIPTFGDALRNGGTGANGTASLSGGGGESGSPDFSGFNGAGAVGGTGRADAGDGGAGKTISANGDPGVQPGGGGGGGFRTTSTTRTGGAGGAGQIRITFTAYVFPAAGSSYAVTGIATDRFTHSVPFDPAVYTLTGGAVTFAVSGTGGAFAMVASPATYTVTGASVLFTHSVPTLSTPYIITGDVVSLFKGYAITASTSSYTVTGSDVSTLFGRLVAATTAAYALTGADVNLVPNLGGSGTFAMAASPDTYTVSGSATVLEFAIPVYHYPINPTRYVLTGSDVVLNHSTVITGARVDALPGTYNYDATAAILGYTRPGDPGAYTYIGGDATLRPGKMITALFAAYVVIGQTATVFRTFPLPAESGTYVITGEQIPWKIADATAGSYALSLDIDPIMTATRYLSTDIADFIITGGDVTMTTVQNEVFFIAMDAGSYVVSGTDATLTYTQATGYGLAGGAESGTYVYTGVDAVPRRTNLAVAADGTTYAFTGATATLSRSRKLVIEVGTYSIQGATFTSRRRPLGGGLFAYSFGSGRDSIIVVRRRRR